MGCNLCEVLGSLRPGTDTDGRLSLLGRVGHLPLLGAGGEDDALGGSRGWSGGERDDRRGTFRCSLEVAWNKDEGGVFVRRFGVERNEKRPRCVLGDLKPKCSVLTNTSRPGLKHGTVSRSLPQNDADNATTLR